MPLSLRISPKGTLKGKIGLGICSAGGSQRTKKGRDKRVDTNCDSGRSVNRQGPSLGAQQQAREGSSANGLKRFRLSSLADMCMHFGIREDSMERSKPSLICFDESQRIEATRVFFAAIDRHDSLMNEKRNEQKVEDHGLHPDASGTRADSIVQKLEGIEAWSTHLKSIRTCQTKLRSQIARNASSQEIASPCI